MSIHFRWLNIVVLGSWSALCSLCSHMCQEITLRRISWEFMKCKSKTQEILEDNEGKIIITTDLWTARNQKRGYMTITAHFVDESWTLQSRTIR